MIVLTKRVPFQLSEPRKMPDGVIPGLENKTNVTDLVWCPFDADELAVGKPSYSCRYCCDFMACVLACDNGIVNVWKVPDEGVDSLDLTPAYALQG